MIAFVESAANDVDWMLFHDPGRVSLARLTIGEYRNAIRDTFGVAPIPMIPYLAAERVGVPDNIVDRVREVEPSRLVSEPADPMTNGDALVSQHAELV